MDQKDPGHCGRGARRRPGARRRRLHRLLPLLPARGLLPRGRHGLPVPGRAGQGRHAPVQNGVARRDRHRLRLRRGGTEERRRRYRQVLQDGSRQAHVQGRARQLPEGHQCDVFQHGVLHRQEVRQPGHRDRLLLEAQGQCRPEPGHDAAHPLRVGQGGAPGRGREGLLQRPGFLGRVLQRRCRQELLGRHPARARHGPGGRALVRLPDDDRCAVGLPGPGAL